MTKWIKTSDDLPEDLAVVIAVKMGFMSEVPWITVYEARTKKFRNIERIDEVIENVTHWMKMPLMPELSE